MTLVHNHAQVTGLPHDHSHAIHIDHIESMYTISYIDHSSDKPTKPCDEGYGPKAGADEG